MHSGTSTKTRIKAKILQPRTWDQIGEGSWQRYDEACIYAASLLMYDTTYQPRMEKITLLATVKTPIIIRPIDGLLESI
jgi:hypothetical protein